MLDIENKFQIIGINNIICRTLISLLSQLGYDIRLSLINLENGNLIFKFPNNYIMISLCKNFKRGNNSIYIEIGHDDLPIEIINIYINTMRLFDAIKFRYDDGIPTDCTYIKNGVFKHLGYQNMTNALNYISNVMGCSTDLSDIYHLEYDFGLDVLDDISECDLSLNANCGNLIEELLFFENKSNRCFYNKDRRLTWKMTR